MSADRMRTLLLGWLAGVCTVVLAGGALALLIVFGGIYDTRASQPHQPIVAKAIHRTMVSSVRVRAERADLRVISPAAVLAGARAYEAHCIACHGGPGVPRAPWAAAMLPTPPFLLDVRNRWSRAELREIVDHGVKLTGMPAWGTILPASRIDDLADFLWVAPSLSAPQFEAIRKHARAQPTSTMDASGPAVSLSPRPLRETQPLDRTVKVR